MKKTLSLVLALALLVGLFPTFAENTAVDAATVAEKLKSYGALKGGTDGDLMLDKNLKREDSLVVLTRLMGKEEEALATKSEIPYEDIKNPFYKPIVAYAHLNKWTQGRSSKSFGFGDFVTAQEFATFMLRALGYTEYKDEKYAEAFPKAKELGLLKSVALEANSKITRADAFVVMDNTLNTVPKDKKVALGIELKYFEKKDAPAGSLNVESVEPAGLKVIAINFDNEVAGDSLANIVVKLNKIPKKVSSIALEGGKTVHVVLPETSTQDSAYEVEVKGVRAASNAKVVVEAKTYEVVMSDRESPEVKSVEVINGRQLKIYTSEPISHATDNQYRRIDTIQIDGKSSYAKIENKNNNVLLVTFRTPIAVGDHKLKISGIRDYANFVAPLYESDITIAEDKEAPQIVKGRMITKTEIELEFNEPVYDFGEFKVNSILVKNPKRVEGARKVRLTLDPKNKLNMSAIVEVRVDYNKTTDMVYNKLDKWTTFTFQVEDDVTMPEASLNAVKQNVVEVKFSKAMETLANQRTDAQYRLLNAKGRQIAFGKFTNSTIAKFKPKSGNTIIQFAFPELADQNSAKYKLEISNLKDGTLRENIMAKTEIEFDGADTLRPTVLESSYQVVSTEKKSGHIEALRIYFSESMNEDQVKDARNYQFSGFSQGRGDLVGATVNVEADAKSVLITFAAKNLFKGGNVIITGVTDLANNQLDVSTVKQADISERLKFSSTSPATVIRKNGTLMLQVKFKSKNVKINEYGSILVGTTDMKNSLVAQYFEGSGDTHLYYLPSSDDAVFYPNATVKMKNDTTASAFRIMMKQSTSSKYFITDIFGRNVSDEIVNVDDGAKPVYSDQEATANKLKIIFTEPVKNANVRFYEGGKLVDTVMANASGNSLVINTTGTKLKPGITYTYKIDTVVDLSGNSEFNIEKSVTIK